MEPITIERVGQELRAQYINSQKRKEKISASIILLKYYVKQQCRNTLKHTMHIWKHNCTKIKCSIAKTSNTMYNSSIMNDILRKKMEKKQRQPPGALMNMSPWQWCGLSQQGTRRPWSVFSNFTLLQTANSKTPLPGAQ